LADLGVPQTTPSVIYEDNQGAIGLAEHQRGLGRAKHIDVRFHFIRQYIAGGDILVRYIPTEKQTADILTKALPAPAFNRHRTSMNVLEP